MLRQALISVYFVYTKEDLLTIAAYFSVSVTKQSKKVIKSELCSALAKRCILPLVSLDPVSFSEEKPSADLQQLELRENLLTKLCLKKSRKNFSSSGYKKKIKSNTSFKRAGP